MSNFFKAKFKESDENIIANSKYFNKEWYCKQYQIPSNISPAKHYLDIGWKDGLDPSLYFSTLTYLDINSDVKGINPLLHYEKFGVFENRNIGSNQNVKVLDSIYFDEEWYRKQYQINVNESAYWHYMNIGYKLFYDPSPYFSSKGYLFAHPDVAKTLQNPLYHYEQYGKRELPARKIYTREVFEAFFELNANIIRESELFNAKWYRDTYNLDDTVDAATHYLTIGSRLQYNPSLFFSELMYKRYYNLSNTDSSLLHFEQYGKYYPCNTYQSVENLSLSHNDMRYYFNYNVDQEKKMSLAEQSVDKAFRPHTESVDIIICVYNAYEDVKKCIESVYAYTSKPYRLIIVDDNSAELTQKYLESVAEENDNVLLIRNTSDNHGYTYAANIGLRASDAEYNVLLNSDTIVSEHWIDNMIKCALERSADLVGPLSNTASWQSIPKLTDDDGDWCHNVLPPNISVHSMAKLVEESSEQLYPTVPLLNGFCMMVSRKAINELGYFDEENFGRGFAEEDDYTSRAVSAGLKLAIADDTYIFHAQSKSYSDEKRLALCKISGERLRQKHGHEYIENCCKIMYSNFILDSIRYRTQMEFERRELIENGYKLYAGKKVLFLLPTSNASGGANVIISEATCMVKMGVDVTIMNLESNRKSFEIAYPNLNIPVIYVENFKSVRKHVEHFDVVCCSLFSTIKNCVFKKKNEHVQVAYYIQDYEPYFFLEKNERWKEAVESYTLIPECINVTKTTWNANEVYKNTGAHCNVIGPSVNVDLFKPRKMWGNTEKIVITAMLRPMTARRGPEMTYRVLREIAKKYGEKVEINFFGCDADLEYESALFFNREPIDFAFTNYGLLTPEDTASLLSKTDIFVDFSTFQAMGLTAMEAMASGCATILTKFGGTSDFARHEKNSLLIDTTCYDTCIETVDALIRNPEIRTMLSQNAYRDMCQYYPEKAAFLFLENVFPVAKQD